MKRSVVALFTFFILLAGLNGYSQCSICTKTAQQMGEKPAKALNSGIVYLAATPLAILAVIGMRWWKSNKDMF
ncbi:hypothetical protein [Flavihumibacter profundi]|jgi:hypothetical protein|uniref:hypothetical protein n=1 Tax=Flavihumibacter profundi TaxID=2716883 RepID=UPI001CC3F8B7|nr:hypothetical protein [Flavihumibacter profundi]MBZ5858850.1 hypothetical protein [Flavihumibacter profundi]